ncbi:hypothetical protein BGZ63DRAFT_456016 [Mariannaea sp. PMI_226]|nr:hypothetical protein BGZ63DRAFT_456016 [Mariannaea sp. PMI_226]
MYISDLISCFICNEPSHEEPLIPNRRSPERTRPSVRTVKGRTKERHAVRHTNGPVGEAREAPPKVQAFIPEMQVISKSLCDSTNIFHHFVKAALTIGIGANIVQTYQGAKALKLIAAKLDDDSPDHLAAQTSVDVYENFPHYVYDMVEERLISTQHDPAIEHWFFIYHPDNDWYPKFNRLLRQNSLGPRFCGFSNQIDTIFMFMLAARRRIKERKRIALKNEEAYRTYQKRGSRQLPVKLHLLLPAYSPILIPEALKIPDEIGDFVMEGRINDSTPYVWLNFPNDQTQYLQDIGNWTPPSQSPGWWDCAMASLGMSDMRPELVEARVLGTSQRVADSRNPVGDLGDGDRSGDDGVEKIRSNGGIMTVLIIDAEDGIGRRVAET